MRTGLRDTGLSPTCQTPSCTNTLLIFDIYLAEASYDAGALLNTAQAGPVIEKSLPHLYSTVAVGTS